LIHSTSLAVAALIATVTFILGYRRATALLEGDVRLASLPGHYGWYSALWGFVPAVIVCLIGSALPHSDETTAATTVLGASVLTALVGSAYGWSAIRPRLRARIPVERFARTVLAATSMLALLVTVGILLSLIFESLRFFQLVSPMEFLFGTSWSPQIALRPDQVGSSGTFGAIPLFTGTLLITVIAIAVAGPLGLMAAIYTAYYADRRVRMIAKPTMELLAGVPTVVYGFFAALFVAPLIRSWGNAIGLDVASESALAAGSIMGIMIIPLVASLSDDAISAVPDALRDASYALGATRSETIIRAIIPAAIPGLVAAFLLAISRAIGETMIVVMAAGLSANLTANPLEAVTTVTVQIVSLLAGDQQFDSAKTLAAFALGLVLFCVTLVLNGFALELTRRWKLRRG